MNRVIGMVLEMVVCAMVVIFLLSYLAGTVYNGRSGVWSGIADYGTGASETMTDEEEEQTKTILAAQCPEVRCMPGRVRLNQVYGLTELFTEDADCFLEVEEVYLGGVRVLEKGDIAALAEAEMPAAVLYDTAGGELMFTRTGTYYALLRVGTVYGWKPCREVWVTIPTVSDFILSSAAVRAHGTVSTRHGNVDRGCESCGIL